MLFGLLAGLLVLELVLRTAGFIVLSLQERGNRRTGKDKSEYVILCLGESTTAVGGRDSYPRQLERILNQRNPGKKVAVINKGIIGTNTTAIVSRLEEYLNQYRPDMVIAMMGINEGLGKADTGGVNLAADSFPGSLRVYKLFRLLWDRMLFNLRSSQTSRNIQKEVKDILSLAEEAPPANPDAGKRQLPPDETKGAGEDREAGDWHFDRDEWEAAIPYYRQALQTEPGNTVTLARLATCLRELGRFQEDRGILRRLLLLDPRNPDVYVELGNSFRNQQAWEAAEVFYRQALALTPEQARAYREWGNSYKMQGDSKHAIPLFSKAIELDPDNLPGYIQLARYYDTLGDFDKAERMFKKALKRDPEYSEGYAQLGRFYDWRGRTDEAEIMCKKAIEINPENTLAYAKLGDIYKGQGRLGEAEQMYQKALDIDPLNSIAFRVLAVWYLRDKKYEKAEKLCAKILEINPRHDRALGTLALCFQAQGKTDLAEKYFNQANTLRAGALNSIIDGNYQKVRKLVAGKGIQLVCVQYPMRDVDNLKRMFPDPSGIIFVDNEAVFKTALAAGSYGDLFTDCFAGDFGHCTPRGNRLLAENIADTIFPVIK